MIRCLAVDDESYAAEIISTYIQRTPFLVLVAKVNNAFEALSLVEQGKVDLVFLDIHMPELNGIQFLKMCGTRCRVILTTAYSEYAIEGFDLDVVDYLLKPVSYERFYKSALKGQQLLQGSIHSSNNARKLPLPVAPNDFIFIKGDNKNRFIKVNHKEILYIEALNNYVSIYTAKQRIVSYHNLRELEQLLPQPAFYRLHRSYIVSIAHIEVINSKHLTIANRTIPIGETYRDDFFKFVRS